MAASTGGVASCLSSSVSSSPPPPPTSSPSPSPSPSTIPSSQKPINPLPKKKNSVKINLADQLQPLSKQFLHNPPPSHAWTSPSRRKARDSPSPNNSNKKSPPPSVRQTLMLLEKTVDPDQLDLEVLDDEVGFLTCKDMVAILQAQTRWRRSLIFFNWLRSKSFQLNAYVYNVMLKILRKAGKWETGKEIAEDMVESGIELNNITYSTIISFAIQCKKPDEALEWFSRMRDGGCVPDSVTFASVIDVHVKSGRIREAEELCSEMQRQIQPWDSVVYSQIMKLHGLQKDYDQMWEVYKKMQEEGLVPNVVTFNSLISLLGNAGRSMQALRVFNDMLGFGLKPSPVTLSLMFKSFAKSKHSGEAFELYERMNEEGWVVDSVVYNSLLSLCAQLGKVDEGEKIYKELLNSKRCRPDDWTWRTLVDMYVKGGKVEEARRITKEMVSRGRVIDLPVYMGLIQGYAKKKDFKLVVELFDEVKKAGMPMDHMLAGVMLNALVQCQKAQGEETLPLTERIGIIYPKLKTVIENLSKEEPSIEEMREDVRAMLNGASEDCRRPFCNLLIDLCYVKEGLVDNYAQELLAIAISFGVYPNLQNRSTVEWRLKLRLLSFGAARAALSGWISSLRDALKDGELPSSLSIEVGMGILIAPHDDDGDSSHVMKTFILKLLQGMNAPFGESKFGRLNASNKDVKAWLLSSESSMSA